MIAFHGGRTMIAHYNRRSLAFGIAGVTLQVASFGGSILVNPRGEFAPAAFGAAYLVGTGLLVCGLALYAKAKGRSALWAVFAILGFFGLLILAVLKDLTAKEG